MTRNTNNTFQNNPNQNRTNFNPGMRMNNNY